MINALFQIENQFIPELVNRFHTKGFKGFGAYAEPIGNSINIVIVNNGHFVQEFAISMDQANFASTNGAFFMPVFRT